MISMFTQQQPKLIKCSPAGSGHSEQLTRASQSDNRCSRIHRVASLIMSALLLLPLSTISARAEQGLRVNQDPERDTKIRMLADLYCKDNGKLVRCVGLHASDCHHTAEPFIDHCLSKFEAGQPGTPIEQSLAFDSCFNSSFNERYADRYEISEECAQPVKDPESLQPMTPELAKAVKPFNLEEQKRLDAEELRNRAGNKAKGDSRGVLGEISKEFGDRMKGGTPRM